MAEVTYYVALPFLASDDGLVAGDVVPDLTLILDLPVAIGLERARARATSGEDRFERMGVAFHEKLRAGFLEIARAEPKRCVVVDATRSVDAVLAEAGSRQVAVMCSESLWWRCHRRLLADFVSVARETEVRHLMHDGRTEAHQPGPGLRLRDDRLLVYDGGQGALL